MRSASTRLDARLVGLRRSEIDGHFVLDGCVAGARFRFGESGYCGSTCGRGIDRLFACLTFRHSFVAHLLIDGTDISRELLSVVLGRTMSKQRHRRDRLTTKQFVANLAHHYQRPRNSEMNPDEKYEVSWFRSVS